MTALSVISSPLSGLKLIQRKPFCDNRGSFSRLFCSDLLQSVGLTQNVAQINHSYTIRRGTLRGLHYQRPPHSELKLVTCIRGEVWDVAVDLRANSPTFLQYYSRLLTAQNSTALLIPEGFAHGFQAQTDDCDLIYLHTASYNSQSEAGLRFDDPRLAISWPIPVTLMSARDKSHPLLTHEFRGLTF